MAEKLAKDLEAAVKRNNELRLALLSTPKAPNPYADWTVPNMQGIGGTLGLEDLRGQSGAISSTPPINIVVELDGQAVGGAITNVQTNQSLSGSFVSVNRQGRFAARPDEG